MGPAWSASEIVILLSHAAVVGLLSILGVHRLALVIGSGRREPPLHPEPPRWPRVTVQLPVMNERYVVERLLRSVAAVDYPRDRLEVQVLDDSTDDTSAIVASLVDELRAGGLRVVHLRRAERRGFKAGALAAGLESAEGELLLILDADFVVPPHFLRRAVRPFARAEVGMVQARWGHLAGRGTALAAAQALMLDGHFAVQQRARFLTGRFFNFNGTAGIFRREAIVAAGGWHADTLTEDLDLSYRMQLAGYRGVYLDGLEAPAELPEAIGALKSQQHRWAKGSLETCRKLLGAIWQSPVPLLTKVEATFHLSENGAYLLLLLLSILSLPALAIRHARGLADLAWIDGAALACGMGSLAAFYAAASVRRGAPLRILHLPLVMALGVGLSLNNSLAVVGGLAGTPSEFVRTPKTGGRRGAGYRPRRDLLCILELALGAWTGGAALLAYATGAWAALPFVALLAAGHVWVGVLSLGSLLWPTARAGACPAPARRGTGRRLRAAPGRVPGWPGRTWSPCRSRSTR